MSHSTPFHKQLDPNKQAGQIVFSPMAPKTVPGLCLDSGEFIPAQDLNALHKQETTLAQYIERKTNEPKKITFAEWSKDRHGFDLTQHYFVMDSADMLECWNTALTKGKL